MNLEEKRISGEYIYKGKVVTLKVDTALLPNGNQAKREVIEHPGGVVIAALTENDELFFVEQFRYPYQEVVLELPAGKLEFGEDPLKAGKRELEEETGTVAENYINMGVQYPSPGYCDEVLHMYLATGLSEVACHPDDDEFLEVKKIHIDDAVRMVLSGEIKDGKTQTLILKTYLFKQNGNV